jgi:AGZA family xanthine/uracil permease-like MFS transporter
MTAEAGEQKDEERRKVGRLDRFFELSERGSTLASEIRGGVVTFIAMAYIVVLNPIILSAATRTSTATAWASRRSPPRHRWPRAS